MRATKELENGVLASQRLLVVEDMDDARTSMQQLLKLTLKIEVDATNDGAQALKLLGERPYSVVITDLRMMDSEAGINVRKELLISKHGAKTAAMATDWPGSCTSQCFIRGVSTFARSCIPGRPKLSTSHEQCPHQPDCRCR